MLNIKWKYLCVCLIWVPILAFFNVAGAQDIPERPNPPVLVNDYSKVLSENQRRHLEEKLVAYDDSTSVQIAVVIIPTLNGANVDDYAIELGRKWGVGNKKTNNGVVLLMTTGQGPGKNKIFIAPGYGLEASLSDYTCKTIIDAIIIPEFKRDNLYRGIENGVDAIISATRGQFTAPPGYGNRGKGDGGGFIVVLIILFIIFIFIAGRKGGGGGGDAMTRRGHRHMDNIPPFIFFPPIGGGGRGGGGFGGGGGGFGGFGGGGFGGGGAGGSW
jgi:uncharacterized protein